MNKMRCQINYDEYWPVYYTEALGEHTSYGREVELSQEELSRLDKMWSEYRWAQDFLEGKYRAAENNSPVRL